VTVQLNTIPRTAVKATLQGLRLPICGVEILTRQTRNESWPPAIAFEGFEAGVKQIVGSILRDEELVEEGRVQQAKVTELRRAVDLEVRADQKRAAGDRELRERQAQVEEERTKAEQNAARREQVIAKQV
jgi:soluble cytochrome b562